MKHFLATDDSGHWYVVPADRRAEFNRIDQEITDYWAGVVWKMGGQQKQPEYIEFPDWVIRIDGGPSGIEFENWSQHR